MISDEEIDALPADPELAFVQFERILRERVRERIAEEVQSEGRLDADQYREEYINRVHAAAKVYGITALNGALDSRQVTSARYAEFTADVDHVTMQIRLHASRRDRPGSVGLDDTSKAKIHHWINQIREVINQSDLPLDKRESLTDKLNKFAAEVDRVRTSLQSAMAVYIAVMEGIGDGFAKLEPARKWIDSIAGVLGYAKAGEEQNERQLPRPAERKQIESRSSTKSQKRMAEALDDDIPF